MFMISNAWMSDLRRNKREFSAIEIASLIEGEVIGDRERKISNLAKIEDAGSADLSFIANPKYVQYLSNTKAGVVIIEKDLEVSASEATSYIKVKDPYLSFTRLMKLYSSQKHVESGVHETAVIHPTASVHPSCSVGAHVVIEEGVVVEKGCTIMPQVYLGSNASIGAESTLYPGVKVYTNCEVGKKCILHSGAVIGSDGFGFAPKSDGTFDKIPQLGNVRLEDEVEIGANSTLDRATMGSTIIARGAKIDNLVQIGHNVVVGENTVIAAQTGISGSTKIGKNCFVGGQVGFVGHITIADGSMFGAKTGVNRSLKEENKKWDGTHALPYRDSLKSKAFYRHLPEFDERLRRLEKLFSESKVIN
jgi:UDP-3-O-[3-hydroxymyristoyl] glucosamine N-acyltransferase